MTAVRAVRTYLALFAFGAASASYGADAQPFPISFSVQGNAVTATGLSAGGPVAVLNVSVRSSGSSQTVTRTWRDARAGADGAVSVTFAAPVAQGAFIAVIDVESGRIGRTSGTETSFAQVGLPEKRFKRNASRDVDQVTTPLPSAMLVVVRRGVGAWLRVGDDGGSGDADGQVDGRVTTDPAAMQPIAYSPEAPAKIKHKDVVLLIDPQCLCFATTEVQP